MPKAYQVQDRYFLLAKEKGYRARSAFKLLDINKKFSILRAGQTVVDLGAAPGSFLQVISSVVGPKGKAFGIDLQEIDPFPQKNIITLQCDIFDKDAVLATLENAGFKQVDVVTSDLAPKTSGIRDLDQGLSEELTDQAFYLSTQLLKKGGSFVGKIFEGPEMALLIKRIKRRFKHVHVFKPPACRDRSFETYIVAIGFMPLA
ncbi:MAG: RlmE family RNA methyltransferase [Candidatus Gracilibacteria bacterium]